MCKCCRRCSSSGCAQATIQISTLIQAMKRRPYVVSAVVLCVWLAVVVVGLAVLDGVRVPASSSAGAVGGSRAGSATSSLVGSSFGAMLARRNHSVMSAAAAGGVDAVVGCTTAACGRGVVVAPTGDRLPTYRQSPGVAATSSGATSRPRLRRFSLQRRRETVAGKFDAVEPGQDRRFP